MRRVVALVFVTVLALAACGETSVPPVATGAPQNTSAPTQTRGAELALLATLTAPTPMPNTQGGGVSLTVNPPIGAAGVSFSLRVVIASALPSSTAIAVEVMDGQGFRKPQDKVLQTRSVELDRRYFLYDSTGDNACSCTAHVLVNGQRAASVGFIITAASPDPQAAPAGGSVPGAPTVAPVESLRITLQYEIDLYDSEVFRRYAPSDRKYGDWRPFNLKMESWLPQHPAFQRYYSWVTSKPCSNCWLYITPNVMVSPEWLDRYLAEQR